MDGWEEGRKDGWTDELAEGRASATEHGSRPAGGCWILAVVLRDDGSKGEGGGFSAARWLAGMVRRRQRGAGGRRTR